jgi:hypothetical protein
MLLIFFSLDFIFHFLKWFKVEMPSPWTFSESEGQVRIQNLIVPIDFGLEEFCTPAHEAINNQTKIIWVSVIYMQVDWSIILFSM